MSLSPFCFFTVWSTLFVDFFTLALLFRIFSEVAFLVPDSYNFNECEYKLCLYREIFLTVFRLFMLAFAWVVDLPVMSLVLASRCGFFVLSFLFLPLLLDFLLSLDSNITNSEMKKKNDDTALILPFFVPFN